MVFQHDEQKGGTGSASSDKPQAGQSTGSRNLAACRMRPRKEEDNNADMGPPESVTGSVVS
jgi:hypothetical protein